MYPHQVIYRLGRSKVPGEVYLRPKKAVKFLYHTLRGLGAGLVAFAIVGIIFSFYPIAKSEWDFRFASKENSELSKFGQIIDKSMAEDLGLSPYFSLYIPRIDAKANVITNVDAASPKAYLSALEKGVAHAAGTNFPGQGKTIYLFSHSTDSPINIARYNATFYLLRKLEKGDRILTYFLGQEHVYIVEDKFTTGPTDTKWIEDDGGGERLVLQTCDPPGTTLRRLIVVARPL